MSENVRLAKLEDLSDLLTLLQQIKPGEKTNVETGRLEKTMSEIVGDKNHYIAVYELDNRLVGTATLIIQLNLTHDGRPYGHIENVVTDEKYRGKGVGKGLMDFLIKEAKERGCYKLVLDCAKDKIPFYEKRGFDAKGSVEMRMDL